MSLSSKPRRAKNVEFIAFTRKSHGTGSKVFVHLPDFKLSGQISSSIILCSNTLQQNTIVFVPRGSRILVLLGTQIILSAFFISTV